MIRFILDFVCLFLGAVLFVVPEMTRRGILFAVRVPPDFRDSPTGRRSIARYRSVVAIAVLIVLGTISFTPIGALRGALILGQLAVILASGFEFFRQRRKLMPFAVQPTQMREAELSDAPDEIPGFVWLGVAPFAMLAAAAASLHANWDSIPLRFPVHYGVDGQPNRWSERSTRGVYGPLLFGAEICAFMLILALAGWFGSRRSEMRSIVLGLMVAIDCTIGLIFSGIAINPIAHLPIWLIAICPLVLIALLSFVAIRRMSGMSGDPEPTPDECWRGGVIYYNPEDTALFVEKRTGLGYTMNFGNRWSWVLMAGLVAMIGSTHVLF